MASRKRTSARTEPSASAADLRRLMDAIAGGELATIRRLLKSSPELANATATAGATRTSPKANFLAAVGHYIYQGDTALHVAAAAYRKDVAKMLLAGGADVNARNRRGAGPIHYASDGDPGSARWAPRAQAAMIAFLIEKGADPDATDKSGVAPIHRAVRTRCSAAVRSLLASGANPRKENANGSTPMDLAMQTTGRGGSGSAAARKEQEEILLLLVES